MMDDLAEDAAEAGIITYDESYAITSTDCYWRKNLR